MSSLDRDAPFPYVSLIGVLVHINLFIFNTWKGMEWAVWYHAFGPAQLFAQPKLYADFLIGALNTNNAQHPNNKKPPNIPTPPPTVLAWNIMYRGLYDVCYVLHNPFGSRRIDVAHETIGAGLRRLSQSLMLGTPHLPPSMGAAQTTAAAKLTRVNTRLPSIPSHLPPSERSREV